MIKTCIASFSRLCLCAFILLSIGCSAPQVEEFKVEVRNDKKGLSQFLDLEWVKPDSVSWVFKVKPQKNSRITVPGPTDNIIEAILYFGEDEIEKIRAASINSPTRFSSQKKLLTFSWLPEDMKTELSSEIEHTVFEDQWFVTIRSGIYIILDKAVVLANSSL